MPNSDPKTKLTKIRTDEADKGKVFHQFNMLERQPEDAIPVPVSQLNDFVKRLQKAAKTSWSLDNIGWSLISAAVTSLASAIALKASVPLSIITNDVEQINWWPSVALLAFIVASIACGGLGGLALYQAKLNKIVNADAAEDVAGRIKSLIAVYKKPKNPPQSENVNTESTEAPST